MLLACSAAGDKLKPLVIEKSLKPRCFRGIDKAALPITYRTNKKAWMTSSLFKEWLERLNSKMHLQGRHILLFVDNCGAHPDIQLTNIKMLFLPPNTTSRLQPCDAGIIAAFKAHYRKRLMRHVLAEMDDARTATELSKRVDMLDAIRWLYLAWASVSSDTIAKCFAKCGFGEMADVEAEAYMLPPEGAAYDELLGVVSWGDYVAMDEATSTTDIASRRQLRPLQSPRRWPWDMWENLYRLRCSQMMRLWWKPSRSCRTLFKNIALNRLQWLSRSPF